MTKITIYEDNAGAVYLGNGTQLWGLGSVTLDLEGTAAEHAKAWTDKEWFPNEADGQVPADYAGLDIIAEWSPRNGLNIARCGDNQIVAGSGGCRFLGIETP
jgi:hypothetical protein